ncbi:hypothetical protein [Sphingomonas sp.]|uniref:hypothetical protein n=1 Tax=Sphingomonas sp. TaxID=28214 RepID=UPI001B022998|nr:hypothetical protein [Sphingomonas sp.]MBO9714472.1 hypothetical protein [Sphingomonas sp.]
MLWVLRLLTLVVGVGTGWRLLDGVAHSPVLKWPEAFAAVALVVSAMLPRGTANGALIASNSFALGVFSLVLSGYLVPGRPVDPLLIAAMALNLASVLLLISRGGGH